MKHLTLIAAVSVVLGLAACAQMATPDKDIGLSKADAFDTPTPQSFVLDGSGAAGGALAAYAAPPVVPHAVDGYVPITRDKNTCLSCHDKPGTAKKRGEPAPIPASHYVQVSGKPQVSGAHYNCELCHAPVASVPDLVGNSAR